MIKNRAVVNLITSNRCCGCMNEYIFLTHQNGFCNIILNILKSGNETPIVLIVSSVNFQRKQSCVSQSVCE